MIKSPTKDITFWFCLLARVEGFSYLILHLSCPQQVFLCLHLTWSIFNTVNWFGCMVNAAENLESHHQRREKKVFPGYTEIISNTVVSLNPGGKKSSDGENSIAHSYQEWSIFFKKVLTTLRGSYKTLVLEIMPAKKYILFIYRSHQPELGLEPAPRL